MPPLSQAVKRGIPDSLRPLSRKLYHALYRAALRVQWRLLDSRQPPSVRAEFPLPPARPRFRVAENATFDLIYGVSAFTHLSEEHHKVWLPEWYQTAFQSQPSIVHALSAHFTEVGYLERNLGDQDVAVAKKAGA